MTVHTECLRRQTTVNLLFKKCSGTIDTIIIMLHEQEQVHFFVVAVITGMNIEKLQ